MKAFYSSFLTFDFAQIQAAYSSLYSSYTTYPQCSYGTNVVSLGTYMFIVKAIYKELAPISLKLAKTFGMFAKIFYDLTAGLESNIQTSYVVISLYELVTNTANVSTTQIADIIGYVIRMFLVSLIVEKPGPKPGPDMWFF